MVQTGKSLRTLPIRPPSWEVAVRLLSAVLTTGTKAGAAEAAQELARCARIADAAVGLLEACDELLDASREVSTRRGSTARIHAAWTRAEAALAAARKAGGA